MTFLESVGDAAKDGLCSVLSTSEAITNFGRNLVNRASYSVVGGAVIPSGGPNPIGALSRAFCNREPPTPTAPSFSGGQCDGVLYRITYQWTLLNGPDNPRTAEVYGPIVGIGAPQEQSNNPNASFVLITARGFGPGGPSSEPFTFQLSGIGNGGFPEDTSFAVLSVDRADGQPDQCGDPPNAILPPPEGYNRQTVPNFTYIDNSGDTVNLGDLNLVYLQPTINANADIRIPVNVEVGDVSFGLDILPNGTVEFNFGSSGRRGADGSGPDEPSIDEDPPNAPDDVPLLPPGPPDDPAAEQSIVGCLVTVTQVTTSTPTVIFQDDNPDIYAPNLGFVQFLIRLSGVRGGWTLDIPVKNRAQIIPCPWPYGAIAVRGTPRPGVEFTITPIYRETLIRREPEILPPVIAQ